MKILKGVSFIVKVYALKFGKVFFVLFLCKKNKFA